MKAHQNQDMKYDDMYDYGMSMRRRTLREATYCLYGIINDITVQMLKEREISVRVLQFILIVHRLLPLLEGCHLTD